MGDRAPRYGIIWGSFVVLASALAWGSWRLGLPLWAAIPLGIVAGYVIAVVVHSSGRHEHPRGPRDPDDPRP